MAKRRKSPKIRIKDAAEIEHMRAAGRTASEILQLVAKAVVPGVTTGELDELVRELIDERGCKSAFHGYRGFPGQACLSVNEEIVHGIGGARKLQFGDLIKIDVGIVQNGWIGDNATSVPVGEVGPETKRLMAATEQALFDAIDRARAGLRLAEIGAAVEDRVTPLGYSVVREFVGHGVGRELHEEPQIPNFRSKGKTPVLQPGMILAIEPMVNQGTAAIRFLEDKWTVIAADRRMSAHYEHTVLVTDGEPELLTWRPREATPELLGIG
jgi:methionyl aminopeptidase